MLSIKNLTVEFLDTTENKPAINDISFHISKGEILGIAGESGSGKTMLAYTIDGILPEAANISSGEILYNGKDLLGISELKRREVQGSEFGIVFQEPLTSLNPLYKIGAQVEENLLLHTRLTKKQRKKEAIEMLRSVELEDAENIYNAYPHQLSGGMRQRVMIASALIHQPKLLIADEPTTALDVIIQAQLVKLLKKINKERGVAIIFISHNLLILKKLANNLIIMKNGIIVERGSNDDIFENPKDKYTMDLINAINYVNN